MPQPIVLAIAKFQEISWNDKGKIQPTSGGKNFQVQFNPQTLKLTYSNQKAGGDQPKGSSTQFVGRGVTKLALELWFDVALAQAQNGVTAKDVRKLTQEVVYFMIPKDTPTPPAKNQSPPPPGLQITWGAFSFAGVMDSLDETLDFFSADGYPLRSSLAISISRQEIQYDPKAAATIQKSAGIQTYTPVPGKKPFQQMAAEAGSSSQPGAPGWQALALANGIENPRIMAAGALVDVSAGVSVSANAQLGVTPQTSGALSLNLGAQGNASGGVSLGFVGSATSNGGGSAGVQASASFSAGI